MPSFRNRQRGTALIVAMLIVAMVTAVVVSTSWRFQLGMSRNEHRWHGVQARLILEGSENLAGQLLLKTDIDGQDGLNDGNADHLGEPWNNPMDFVLDAAQIRVEFEDAQSRFNINLLALPKPDEKTPGCDPNNRNDNPESFSCKYNVSQRRFIRLLQALPVGDTPLTPDQAKMIVDSIIDWMDPDQNPSGFGGAEQSFYNGGDVPIVVSNAPMATISELSLVKGVRETPGLYDALLPLVIALPAAQSNASGISVEPGLLNINTMDPIFFRTFASKDSELPWDDPEALENLKRLRSESIDSETTGGEGYQNIDNFVNTIFLPETPSISGPNDFDKDLLDIKTHYFIYSPTVELGDKIRKSKVLMYRDAQGNTKTLWRTDANF